MNDFLIAQIIGCFTVISTIIGLFQKEKFKTMIFFTITNITMMATYFFLGRWLSIILVGIAALRTIVYYYYAKKNMKPNNFVMVLFEVLFVVTAVILWEDYVDLLMLANLCLLTYTTWQDNMKILRIGYIASSILLLVYDITVLAYVSAISEFLLLISSFASFIKYDIKNKIKNVILAFYQTISKMYDIKIKENKNFSFITSELIDDEYNNFALIKDVNNYNNSKNIAVKYLTQNKLIPAIYFESKGNENIHAIMDIVRKNKLLYHDVWMKLRTGHNMCNKKCLLENLKCHVCDNNDKKEIINIFDKGFVHQLGENIYKYSKKYIDIYESRLDEFLLNDKNFAAYMATYNDKPIAILTVYRKETNAFLCQITTLHKYRRKGVASQLIKYAIATERKLGIEDFYLVTEKYTWLEAFYMKNSFEEICEGFCVQITKKRKK